MLCTCCRKYVSEYTNNDRRKMTSEWSSENIYGYVREWQPSVWKGRMVGRETRVKNTMKRKKRNRGIQGHQEYNEIHSLVNPNSQVTDNETRVWSRLQ
jgi:hypothetical protein